jgi:hypothetical protein
MASRKKDARNAAERARVLESLSRFDEHAFPTRFVNGPDDPGRIRVQGDSEEEILAHLVWDMVVRKALKTGVDLWSEASARHWAAVQLVVRGAKAVPILMTDDQVAQALAESRRQQPRPSPGLAFDDARLTVTLDGAPHEVLNPKAYHVYKAIVTRTVPKITGDSIRKRVPGVNGQKTIRSLIDGLPKALRLTVKSDTHGYWFRLP